MSLIACQCERHAGLHVNADGLYVEILWPDGSPCEPGKPGRVVVTDLLNHAMPILRYEVGDMACWAGRDCSCGRGLPLLEKIEGRVADYVVTPNGEWVSGISLTDHFNTRIPGVIQMQIVQEALDQFTFRIVRGADFGPQSQERICTVGRRAFRAGGRLRVQISRSHSPRTFGKISVLHLESTQKLFSRLRNLFYQLDFRQD